VPAVGGDGGANVGGAGGAGVSNSISGSALFYAAGGGGTTFSTTVNGSGGLGGSSIGGNGVTTTGFPIAGTNGTANRGAGGGGGSRGSGAGGNGGSGIIILKYSDALTITIGAGLTGTTAAPSGGFKVTTITSGTGNVSWA